MIEFPSTGGLKETRDNAPYAQSPQIEGIVNTRFLAPWASSTTMIGIASNPLENSSAATYWNVSVNINSSGLNAITGSASGVHTCFPAHVVTVNEKILYQWLPIQNDPQYVFNCLVPQIIKIQFQSPIYRVPCNL